MSLAEDFFNLTYSNTLKKIQILPVINFEYELENFITGKVLNLDIDKACYISGLNQDCYQISGIYLNNFSSEFPNLKVVLKGNNLFYFLPTSLDINNEGWFIEIGTICSSTFNFNVVETLIPVNKKGEFKSCKKISKGFKFIRLYHVKKIEEEIFSEANYSINLHSQITNFNYENLYFLENKNLKIPFFLNQNKPILNWQKSNFEEYKIDLFETLISWFPLIFLPQNKVKKLEQEDYIIDKTLQQNILYLVNLILYSQENEEQATLRKGSLTKKLFQLYNPELLYGDLANELQTKIFLSFIDNNCFEENCIKQINNSLIIDRSVDNKTNAWLLLFLIEYRNNFLKINQTTSDILVVQLEKAIFYLANYLVKQFDVNKNYIYKGWTNNNELNLSIQITEEDLATNIIAMISLFKVATINYNQSQNKSHRFYAVESATTQKSDDQSEVVYFNHLYDEPFESLPVYSINFNYFLDKAFLLFNYVKSIEIKSVEEKILLLWFYSFFEEYNLQKTLLEQNLFNDNYFNNWSLASSNEDLESKINWLNNNLINLQLWTDLIPIENSIYFQFLNDIFIQSNRYFLELENILKYKNITNNFYIFNLYSLNRIYLNNHTSFFENNYSFLPKDLIRKFNFYQNLYYYKFINYLPKIFQPNNYSNSLLNILIKSLVRNLIIGNLVFEINLNKYKLSFILKEKIHNLSKYLEFKNISFITKNLSENLINFDYENNWNVTGNQLISQGIEYQINTVFMLEDFQYFDNNYLYIQDNLFLIL